MLIAQISMNGNLLGSKGPVLFLFNAIVIVIINIITFLLSFPLFRLLLLSSLSLYSCCYYYYCYDSCLFLVIIFTCSNDDSQVTTAEQDLNHLAVLLGATAVVHHNATPQCPHQERIFLHATGCLANQFLQVLGCPAAHVLSMPSKAEGWVDLILTLWNVPWNMHAALRTCHLLQLLTRQGKLLPMHLQACSYNMHLQHAVTECGNMQGRACCCYTCLNLLLPC